MAYTVGTTHVTPTKSNFVQHKSNPIIVSSPIHATNQLPFIMAVPGMHYKVIV